MPNYKDEFGNGGASSNELEPKISNELELTARKEKKGVSDKERKALVDFDVYDDFERDEYDSDEEFMLEDVEIHKISSGPGYESTTGTSGPLSVCVNIFISFVGAGMLGMPYAYSKSGWLLGAVVMCLTSAANVYCMLLLVYCRKKLESQGHLNITGYGDLGRIILGPSGEVFVNICLVVSQVGFGTAYIIFVAANFTNIRPSLSTGLVCAACIPILSCLVQIRDMKKLSYFSLLADVCNLIGLSSVLINDATISYDFYHDESHPDSGIQSVHISATIYMISICMYSLEGVGMILPLESSCKNREQFPFILKSMITFVTLLMVIFGIAGYVAFGNETKAPITLNLQSGWATFVKLALCTALYLTYPIMLFPVHDVVEDAQRKCSKSTNSNAVTEDDLYARKSLTPTNRVIRASFVCFSAIIAYAVPDFGMFLGLVGSSICVILALILPCYIHICVFSGELSTSEQLLDWCLLLFGVVFGIYGTFQSVIEIMDGGD